MTVGIISFENFKERVTAQAKGYKVPHPHIKTYCVSEKHARIKFGPGLTFINLNKEVTFYAIK